MKNPEPIFRAAIGLIEDDGPETIQTLSYTWMILGDQGRALGKLQFHPETFVYWWKPVQGQTWSDAMTSAFQAFYDAAVARGDDDVTAAVGWHLHGAPTATPFDVAGPGARYAAAFRVAIIKAGGVL